MVCVSGDGAQVEEEGGDDGYCGDGGHEGAAHGVFVLWIGRASIGGLVPRWYGFAGALVLVVYGLGVCAGGVPPPVTG